MTLTSRMLLVLSSVGLISGALLTGVNEITADRIALNKQRELEAAILSVVPGTQSSQELDLGIKDLKLYEGMDANGNLIGYAVYSKGQGFQDEIELMFGTDADMTITNSLTILNHLETPGLGAKITDYEVFLRFWENRDIRGALTLRKPAARAVEELAPTEVNTITGATISSEAVLKIISRSLEHIKKLKEEGTLGSK